MASKVGTSGRWLLLKSIVTAIICHPLMGRLIGLVWANKIPHRGNRIEVPVGGDPRVNAMLFWGIYESAESRFVQRYLGNDLDVIELGSSLGGVSCQIAKKLAGRKKLVCVEANGQIHQLLRRNVLNNAPDQEVHFLQGAVDYSGKDTIELIMGENNLSSRVDDGAEAALTKMTVPTLTLSGVLDLNKMGDYALVSDIEGAEAGMFVRDSQAFSRCKRMLIELHETIYNDKRYTVQALIELINANTGMILRDRYGSVCVFEKQDSNSKEYSQK